MVCQSIRIIITHSRFLCGFSVCLLMHVCTDCIKMSVCVAYITSHRVAGSFLIVDDRADFSCEWMKGVEL